MSDQTSTHGVKPFFIEGSGGALYARLHLPDVQGSPRGFVICPPFGHESIAFRGALHRLASRLCDAGFPVLLFDLHGCGDSSGDAGGWNLDRWFTDTSEAIDELRARTGVAEVGLVGLRLGGAVATRVAAARPDVERLVLWDPVFEGTSYLSEIRALQASMLEHALVIPDASGSSDEVLGFPLPPALVADIGGIDLVRNIQTRPAEYVLLVETHDAVPQEPVRKFLGSYRCKLANARMPNPQLWAWAEDGGELQVPTKVIDAIVRWAGEDSQMRGDTHRRREPSAIPLEIVT